MMINTVEENLYQIEPKQTHRIYARVTMPISIEVEASTLDEAEMIAAYQLNDMDIKKVTLFAEKVTGEIISPNVCDIDIYLEQD